MLLHSSFPYNKSEQSQFQVLPVLLFYYIAIFTNVNKSTDTALFPIVYAHFLQHFYSLFFKNSAGTIFPSRRTKR